MTPKRAKRLLMSAPDNVMKSYVSRYYFPEMAWRLERRADGKIDIVNKIDGRYVSPEVSAADNQALTWTAQPPAKGWEVKPAAGEKLFTLVCGNVQLCIGANADGGPVVNYGGGMEISDNGVQFRFVNLNEALGLSGVNELPAAAGSQTPVYYDLFGRRAVCPRHGIFIDSTGRKVIL